MRFTAMRSRARLLTTAATGLALALGAGTAMAQDGQQDATEVDEIVVTGIRASLENSVETKRDETSIVEVVSAEDLGKLPDQSITESIARLPGITAQRLDGRAQVISIRGLGPDFTSALLNGREQVTTGDNRGVEFDQFPAELLTSVVVYKTPDASLVAQGLAGTADLRTVHPLEYGRRALALNYRYEWNDLGSLNAGAQDTGERWGISYVDQFLDDTLGIALGYAHMDTPYQNERYNAWGYPNVDAGTDASTPLILGGAKPYAQSGQLVRDGYFGSLEWRPHDQFRTRFDVFYSEFENQQILRGMEIPLWWGNGDPLEALEPGFTVEDGLITQATFSRVYPVIRNDYNTRDANTLSLGWNMEFQLNDDWAVEVDLSHSRVKRTDQIIESYSGFGYNFTGSDGDTITYSIDDRGVAQFDVGLDYTDPNLIRLTDPRGWGGSQVQAGYLNSPTTEDQIDAARFSITGQIDAGFITSMEAGLNFSKRDKSFTSDEWFLNPGPAGVTSAAIPSQCLLEPTTIGFLGFSMISYDTLCVLDSGVYSTARNANFDVIAKNWELSEDIKTLYWQVNFDQDFGPVRMTGNAGFQILDVNQESSGYAAVSGLGSVPITGGSDYTDFLPSANLIFQVGDNDVFRVSAARVQSRPRMDQMRASRQVFYNTDPSRVTSTDINNSPWSGNGGNPNLRPWEADAYDISYEHYFSRGSYISLAAFYKDLRTYVYNLNQLADFTGVPYTGPAPALFQGIISTPQNGEGGAIKGIEIAAVIQFGDFWSPLEGFGLAASYSDTDSDIQPDPNDASRPIEGLSREVRNVTLYYERYGFQARVSNRYRSQFLGEVAGFGNGRTFRTVGAESIVDAQIGYEFQSGPLEGLSFTLQGNNLTDEEFVTLNNASDPRQAIDYQVYGKTYLFGVNYRF